MQHFKEFLIRIQTFDLRIIEDDIHMEWGTNEKKHVKLYDLSHQTQYYDSFSYRSELRVLKDMAFIDLMTLDKERTKLQLEELAKVRERFKEFWRNYHDHHSEMTQVYERHFIFSVNLEYLFIVNGLQSTNAEIEVSSKFAEDLGESVKLREKFLRELIYATETAIKPKRSEAEFKEWLDAEREKQKATTAETTNETIITPKSETPGVPETAAVQEAPIEPELSEEQLAAAKLVGYYPTFKEGAAGQLFDLLKTYFVLEEHSLLKKLLLDDEAPASPLLFRGSATQLADAFKQLKEANLIVGCRMSDLERWIAPKFLYLSPQSQPRELPEDYLNGLMSTKGRPCKSPILKIEQKEDKFFILPASATKNSKKMRG